MVVLNPSWIRISRRAFIKFQDYDSLVSGTGHSHQYFHTGPWGTLNLSARLRSTWGGSAGIFCSSEPRALYFPKPFESLSFATSKFLITYPQLHHHKLREIYGVLYGISIFPRWVLSLSELGAGLIFFSLTLHISARAFFVTSIQSYFYPIIPLEPFGWSPSNKM